MKLKHLAALFLLVPLAGCSSVRDTVSGWMGRNAPGGAEKPVLVEFKPSASIEVRWHTDVGSANRTVLSPALTEHALYAANAKGEVLRLERATGKVVWRAESGFVLSAGVGASEGLVLVGGEKGDVAAWDENGKLRWKSRVSSEVTSAPQVADGLVVLRTADGRITALNVLSGKRQWVYERATPALVVRSNAGVTIHRGVIYAGFAAGKLAALNLGNGALLWEATVAQPRGNTELERISDVTSAPLVDDEQVCAVAFQGRLACFELTQGNALWARDISSDRGMTQIAKRIYLSDDHSVLYALDKQSGSSLWKSEQVRLRRTSTPLGLGKYLALGDFEGYVQILNREDGSLAARLATDGSSILATPLDMDGGVLLQTRNGGLYSVLVK